MADWTEPCGPSSTFWKRPRPESNDYRVPVPLQKCFFAASWFHTPTSGGLRVRLEISLKRDTLQKQPDEIWDARETVFHTRIRFATEGRDFRRVFLLFPVLVNDLSTKQYRVHGSGSVFQCSTTVPRVRTFIRTTPNDHVQYRERQSIFVV